MKHFPPPTLPKAVLRAFSSFKEKPRKLSNDRRRHLVDVTANILREGEPTRFAHEADCRHGIRSTLCLQGWKWWQADAAAADIVATALRRLGATRPYWREGQLEYALEGFTLIERSRCVRCGGKLPEDSRKWCSEGCRASSKLDQLTEDERAARAAYEAARVAAWSAKQPEQPCERCERKFRPNKPGQRFCGLDCARSANGEKVRDERTCRFY